MNDDIATFWTYKNKIIINHRLMQIKSTSTMILFCRGVTTPQQVAINGANV